MITLQLIKRMKAMEIMKVLFLTNVPAPYRVAFFEELGVACDLTVLYDLDNREIQTRNGQWFDNNNINYKSVVLHQMKIWGKRVSFDVLKYIRKGNYDLILIGIYSLPTSMLAIQYMKCRRIRYGLSSDGGFIKKDSKVGYLVKSHFIKDASFYLSTGSNTDAYLQYYGAKINKIYRYPFTSIKKAELLRTPVDNETKRKLKRRLAIKEEVALIMVGQFIPRKGIDILLNAYSKIQSLDNKLGLYIIGDKPTEKYIDLVNKLECRNVHFCGYMNKNQLLEYYKATDIFVMPTREDIWGLVINEAMSCGLPVVTSSFCNAGLELIKNGVNGYIIQDNDEEELVRILNLLIENRTIRERMGEEALKVMQNYTIEESARVYFDILKKQCENSGENNESF